MKKVVIAGPISNYGGREIEVNIILKSLQDNYDLNVLSMSYIIENSFALQGVSKVKWTSLDRILYSKNKIIKLISRFSKLFNKGNKEPFAYVNNSLIKKIINLDQRYLKEIKNQLSDADCVILCVQLTSKFLPEIVEFCHQKNIPCLVRTTGTIRQVEQNSFDFLKKVTLFIHHSEANAKNLNQQVQLPYRVIDQCAMAEESLLLVTEKPSFPLRFGYLGRLSPEKGILPLIDFFSTTNTIFLFAGNGPQKEAILQKTKNATNCTYLGLINSNEIASFFEKIDVLIIPSYEESGPLVGLEAMAAGKIIISTDVGAMKERLSGLSTFWFDVDNPNSLKSAISQISAMSETEILDLKRSIKQRYLEKYNLKAIAYQYQQLVNQCTHSD